MPDRIETFIDSMKIRPGDRILEIGCGHGVAATLICNKLVGGSYLAIDRSEKMIDAAARRNETYLKTGVAEFRVGDFETVDLGAQRFDKVLAMRVRSFHADPERAKRIAEQWLAPGGKLFVQYDEAGNR